MRAREAQRVARYGRSASVRVLRGATGRPPPLRRRASRPQLQAQSVRRLRSRGPMRRKRLLLVLALGIAGALLVMRRQRTPTSTTPDRRLPPPVVKPPAPPVQVDAEGSYVPGYRFTVNRFRFTGFSLRPEALVTLAQTTSGAEQAVACFEAAISVDTIHLRCDDPQVGTVTIDGKFLTRLVTTRLDAAAVTAVVTVRSGSGEILYNARDRFEWHPSN